MIQSYYQFFLPLIWIFGVAFVIRLPSDGTQNLLCFFGTDKASRAHFKQMSKIELERVLLAAMISTTKSGVIVAYPPTILSNALITVDINNINSIDAT